VGGCEEDLICLFSSIETIEVWERRELGWFTCSVTSKAPKRMGFWDDDELILGSSIGGDCDGLIEGELSDIVFLVAVLSTFMSCGWDLNWKCRYG
jgi:hypothetical protein